MNGIFNEGCRKQLICILSENNLVVHLGEIQLVLFNLTQMVMMKKVNFGYGLDI